jgi:hypothetical protein
VITMDTTMTTGFLADWKLTDWKEITQIVQALVTTIALAVGGGWAYRRYVLEQAKYSHIQTSADINFIGKQGDHWIIEIIGCLENKGKVQHTIETFEFDLNALFLRDIVDRSDQWGGQVNFPRELARGSFKPKGFEHFFVGPGVQAKYSHITNVPSQARFLILHCWFHYKDRPGSSHTMEKTVCVPRDEPVPPAKGPDRHDQGSAIPHRSGADEASFERRNSPVLRPSA